MINVLARSRLGPEPQRIVLSALRLRSVIYTNLHNKLKTATTVRTNFLASVSTETLMVFLGPQYIFADIVVHLSGMACSTAAALLILPNIPLRRTIGLCTDQSAFALNDREERVTQILRAKRHILVSSLYHIRSKSTALRCETSQRLLIRMRKLWSAMATSNTSDEKREPSRDNGIISAT